MQNNPNENPESVDSVNTPETTPPTPTQESFTNTTPEPQPTPNAEPALVDTLTTVGYRRMASTVSQA